MFDGKSLFWGARLLPARGGVLFFPLQTDWACASFRLPFQMEMMSRLRQKKTCFVVCLFFFLPLRVCTEMLNPGVCHVSKTALKSGISGSVFGAFVKTHQVWVTEINETWQPRWVHLKCKPNEWIYCATLHYAVFKWPLSICFSTSRSSRSRSPPTLKEVRTARFLIVQNAVQVLLPLFSPEKRKRKKKKQGIKWNMFSGTFKHI